MTTLQRLGEAIYDDKGREVARRIHGWWYRLGKDSIGLPEYAPLDPEEAARMDQVKL